MATTALNRRWLVKTFSRGLENKSIGVQLLILCGQGRMIRDDLPMSKVPDNC